MKWRKNTRVRDWKGYGIVCNAELVNPCKAGRSQGVDVSRYSKGL